MPSSASGRGRQASILVVEDDLPNRNLARRALEAHGCMVVGVASIQEALAMLDACHFDLVLADLRLAVGTGEELLQAIRAHPRQHWLPVVAMTGVVETSASDRARFDAFVAKPYRIVELLAVVERFTAEEPVDATRSAST